MSRGHQSTCWPIRMWRRPGRYTLRKASTQEGGWSQKQGSPSARTLAPFHMPDHPSIKVAHALACAVEKRLELAAESVEGLEDDVIVGAIHLHSCRRHRHSLPERRYKVPGLRGVEPVVLRQILYPPMHHKIEDPTICGLKAVPFPSGRTEDGGDDGELHDVQVHDATHTLHEVDGCGEMVASARDCREGRSGTEPRDLIQVSVLELGILAEG